MLGKTASAVLLALLLTAKPAVAITAKDVMEKMTEKERFGYVTGLVDMLSYTAVLAGNRGRGECISKAFYGDKQVTWQHIFQTFGKFPDKAPEGLIVVLMNRACKK